MKKLKKHFSFVSPKYLAYASKQRRVFTFHDTYKNGKNVLSDAIDNAGGKS
jgi:hypothetical protein